MSRAKRRLLSAPVRRTPRGGLPLQVTMLEDRTVPAVFTVMNTADAGAGSLREAVTLANLAAGADTIDFDATVFVGNASIALQGELTITDSLTIQGTGADKLTIGNAKVASSASRTFNIDNAGANISVVLNQLRIVGGNTTGSGGGILIGKASVTLNNVIVESNVSQATGGGFGGGGIAVNNAASPLVLNSSIVRNNDSFSDGGAINLRRASTLTLNNSTISGNSAFDSGGGIYFFDNGTLNVVGSTISGNFAGTGSSANAGGGIYLWGSAMTATITNSTVSGNVAGDGGGIASITGGVSLTLQNSTVTENVATVGIGGISRSQGVFAPGKTALISSIVADNFGLAGRDAQGAIQATNSLIGAADLLTITGGANRTGTEAVPLDPLLGPLANNGGPTATHSLLPGSPAINGGSNGLNLGADQRGRARVFGIAADIGAYELIPSQVVSFTSAAAPGPTNAAAFNYTIVFNNPTIGLTAANFALTATGTAAGTIGTPTTVDNLTWTIPIEGITGTGTLQLRLVNSTGILPGLSATLPLNGSTVAVDRDAPVLLSITRNNPDPTNAATVSWALEFSEPVFDVGLANFILNATGVTGAALTSVTDGGNIWTVTADTGSGDGSVQLDFADPGIIADAAGNLLATPPTSGPSYTIDKIAPTVVGITRLDPSPTNANTVSWTVEFSQPVVNVDLADFSLFASNNLGGAALTQIVGSGATYTVTASTGNRDSDLRLDLSASDVADEAGNAVGNAPFAGEAYFADREDVFILFIDRMVGSSLLTNQDQVEWTVRFNKPVTGLTLANFLLVESNLRSNNDPHSSFVSLTGSGDTYVVRANTGVNDGDLQLVLEDTDNVTGTFGRTVISLPSFGQSYTVDRTPPTITSVVRNGSPNTRAFSVSWTVTFSEAVTNFDTSRVLPQVTPVTGGTLTFTSVSLVNNNTLLNTSYTVTIDGIDGEGTLGIAFDTTEPLKDLTGNPGTDSLVSFPNAQYLIDQTRPIPTITVPMSTTAGSFPATITFSEPLLNFGPGSVTVTNGTLSGFTTVNATTYTFTVNAKTAGAVTLGVANAVGTDAVGNPNLASAIAATDVNPPAPTITVSASSAGPSNGSVTYTALFSEAVTGFSPAKILLSNGTIAFFTAVSGSEYRFVVAPVADGTVGGTIGAGAGLTPLNVGSLAAALPTFLSDRTKPTVAISGPSGAATSLPISFTIAFSEAVTDFTASDVILSGNAGKAGTATISSFSGSGAVYTVVVDGLSGGTISLRVPAFAAADAAGNVSAASETFSQVFSPPIKQFAVGGGRGGISQIINPTGAIASQSNFFEQGYTSGVRVATGNFTNDGVEDLVLGTGPGTLTNVRIIDGRTGDELFNFQPFEDDFTGGVHVATGDLDGDGIADLIITPDEGGGPRVRAFRGAGFTQLFDFFGIQDKAFRGGARATATDLNGDGRAELIVAAGFGGGPRVTIWDGLRLLTGNTTGSLSNFFAFESALRNGAFVSAADIDGDGRAELVFGAGPGGGPRVRIFRGDAFLTPGIDDAADVIDSQILDQFAGDVTNRGGIRVLAKDIDGDGRAELITGAGAGAGSRVTAYAGRSIIKGQTPTTLFEFDALPGITAGVFVG